MSVLISRCIITIVVVAALVAGLWWVWKPDKEAQMYTFRAMGTEPTDGSYAVYRADGHGSLEVVDRGTCPASMDIEEIHQSWLKHDKRLTYDRQTDPNDIAQDIKRAQQ